MPVLRLLVILLVAAVAGRAAAPSITYPAGPGLGAGKHLVFLTGDEENRGLTPTDHALGQALPPGATKP